MAVPRPRSIVSLILLGFLVVLLPFVLAVVTAVVQVDRFAEQSRLAVENVRAATQYSRMLVEQSLEMRRQLGNFVVRGDPDFLEDYRSERVGFRAALDRLIGLELPDMDAARLRSLAEDEAAVFASVDGRGSAAITDLDAELATLAAITDRSQEVLVETDGLAEQRTGEVTRRAEALQRTLVAIAAVAVPATAILVVVFTLLITRPMGALGAAIRRLGAHALDEPIVVRGPRDIEALAGELEWLRLRIQSLERQKASFLQHISHELKTPLTTIREGSDLLSESLGGSNNPEDAEIARLLRQSGLHLQRLIEDLLRFAKTQELAGELKPEPAVDLARLVGESVASFSVLVDSRSLAVATELAHVAARCDAGRLRTVVDNLLTNAIKYTPEGGRIAVALSVDQGQAVIDVCDSGPGIEPPDRARIFEPFWQGRTPHASSVKGTGLGLSIAKDYVEAHGGSIELVESRHGAHFRVRLPLAGPKAGDGAV